MQGPTQVSKLAGLVRIAGCWAGIARRNFDQTLLYQQPQTSTCLQVEDAFRQLAQSHNTG